MKLRVFLKQNRWIVGVMLIIGFIRLIFYRNVEIAQTFSDSFGYIGYSFSDFFRLNFSHPRTPGYPAVIKIMQVLFGEEKQLIATVIFQIICSFISLIFLYKAFVVITKSKQLSAIIVLFYGGSQQIMTWDTIILTESLTISAVVVFLYLVISYIYTPGIKGIYVVVWVFLITFLKPSLLIWNMAIFMFWTLRYVLIKEERKFLRYLIAASTVSLCLIGIYAGIYSKYHGVFNIADLAPRHLLAVCLKTDIYKDYPDKDLVKEIEKIYNKNDKSIAYDTTTPVMKLFGDTVKEQNINVMKFDQRCLKGNLNIYFKYLYTTLSGHVNAFYTSNNTFIYESNWETMIIYFQRLFFSDIKIGHLYLTGMIEAIITAFILIRKKKISWTHIGLASFTVVSILFVFVGTYSAFERNTVYVIPFFYMSLVIQIQYLLSQSHKLNNL